MFEQLGLLDEITRVSFPRKSMDIYREDLTLISSMLQGELKEKYDPMLQLHVKKPQREMNSVCIQVPR